MPLIGAVRRVWAEADPGLRRRLRATYAFLTLLNVGTWLVVGLASLRYPMLLGLAITAYGFGLRHAVDPDHIAAIDNSTRKLMQDGQKPVGVGLFFSLGHSTVVMLMCAAVAMSASFAKTHLPWLQTVGGVVGTSISGLFLVVIAVVNVVVLAEVVSTWRSVTRGGTYDDRSLDDYLAQRGFFARILRPLLSVVKNSAQLYPIGFLFGLGFDTASEVGLLGMAAVTGANGMPPALIMLLPLLFVAGMSLVDTTDGVAMLGAYGWAFLRPMRKLYYNMTITAISVIVALFVGGLELAGVLASEANLHGGIWDALVAINLENAGYYIVALFLISWGVSALYYRLRNVDALDLELAQRGAATGD